MNRRQFIQSVGVAGLALSARSLTFAAAPATQPAGAVRIGVITDLHHQLFKKDQRFRLTAFIDRAVATPTDFILQCGDFCYPAGCPELLPEWNRFTGEKYHVLGNHDMDKCDKATIMKLWGMPAAYFSFDRGGFHFVVLDRNNFRNADKSIIPYSHGNWYRAKEIDLNCMDNAQMAWFKDDLAKTQKPTVIFMHQPIVATDFPTQLGNGDELLTAIESANLAARDKTGHPRVIAAFLGHDHNDLYAERNGTHFVLLNSASYAYTSYGASFYRDPLYSFITFDPAGKITIEGTSSQYSSASTPAAVRSRIQPKISSRDLPAAV
jgi:predicted phosphodiesterase